jgi:hypothetical protein
MKRRKIAYCTDYAILFDSVEVAVFLSQFEYWLTKLGNKDAYLYKGQEQIYLETGLKESKQKVVRKLLQANQVLFEKRKIVFERKEPKNLLHYRIDFDRIEYLFEHPKEVKTRYESQISNTQKKNNLKKQTSNLQVYKEPEKESDFEVFWKKYDKNVGKSATEKLWNKMPQEAKERALTHAEQLAKNTEKRYRPNPERYLAEQKFLDEIIINQNTKPTLTSNNDEYRSNPLVGIIQKDRK